MMQHFTVPAGSFDMSVFEDGLAFDGSSIRGFQKIHESDMALLPDPTTAYLDPFRAAKTLCLNFFVHDPLTKEPYSRDPRNIARKAENYLASTGIGDTAFFAPEAEFYVFDDVRFETKQNTGSYAIDSVAGAWNTGRVEEGGNRGYKVKYKGGYFPVPPVDHFADLRDVMTLNLEAAGLTVERSHHEVGTAGQAEINYRFSTMLSAGDDLQKFKYIIKNTAWAAGKTATFMPKPIFGDNGSGMHVHSSLWKGGDPLFYDEAGYGGLSDLARWYIGGILAHAPALLAFTNPSVNSFHRLVPGFEAPVNLVYSSRNRSAAMRIPITGTNPKAKRVEFRCPDPSSNPYLAFASLLLAGLDGIQNKTEPPAPIDKDLYELPPEEHANVPTVPDSLGGALDALEADHEFLLQGDVFTPDLIETWVELKRAGHRRGPAAPDPARVRDVLRLLIVSADTTADRLRRYDC